MMGVCAMPPMLAAAAPAAGAAGLLADAADAGRAKSWQVPKSRLEATHLWKNAWLLEVQTHCAMARPEVASRT